MHDIKSKYQLKLLFFLFTFIFYNSNAQVTPNLGNITNTVYIGPNGNDANSGSINAPLATFDEALYHCPFGNNNDTIYSEVIFLAGYYTVNSEIRQPCWQLYNGSGYKAISIRGVHQDSVVLDGSTAAYLGGKFINLLGSGISVQNLTIKMATATDTSAHYAVIDFKSLVPSCINITTSDILVKNIKINGSYDHGLNITESENILVENVEVSNANLININGRNEPGGWGSGIKTRLVNSIEIKNCRVYNCWGEGIANARSTNTYIHNNIVYDNYSVNIYLDNVINGNYFQNLCYATKNDPTYWRAAFPAAGFGMGLEYYADNDFGKTENVKIYNNIILNTQGLYVDDNRPSSEPSAEGYYNVWFVHNTTVGWQGDQNSNVRAVRFDFAGVNNGQYTIDSFHLFNNVFGIDSSLVATSGNGQIVSGTSSALPATLFYGNNIWNTDPRRYGFFNYPFNAATDVIEALAPNQASASNLSLLAPNAYNNLYLQGSSFNFVNDAFFGEIRNGTTQVGALLDVGTAIERDILLLDECITVYSDNFNALLEILGENNLYTINILDANENFYQNVNSSNSTLVFAYNALPQGLFFLEVVHNLNSALYYKTILKE